MSASPPPGAAELEQGLALRDEATAARALVSMTLGGEDPRWIQDRCLRLIADRDGMLRQLAVTCLGHLARIHGDLDLDRVVPVLEALVREPEGIGGTAADTLEDIRIFVPRRMRLASWIRRMLRR